MSKPFTKTTEGWVVQDFNEHGDCISQEFFCGDMCDYNDAETKLPIINPPENETYFPYNMEQPI